MSRLFRLLAAAVLVGVTAFCAFGFLSASEAQDAAAAVRYLYAVVGTLSVGGAGWLAWPSKPMTLRNLVLILLTPLLGAAGFAVGLLAAGVLGRSIYGNYEQLGPSVSWIGVMLVSSGALLGVAIPWLVTAFVWRTARRQ
jgi:hypothetical protein